MGGDSEGGPRPLRRSCGRGPSGGIGRRRGRRHQPSCGLHSTAATTAPLILNCCRDYPTTADGYELVEECGRGVSATVRCSGLNRVVAGHGGQAQLVQRCLPCFPMRHLCSRSSTRSLRYHSCSDAALSKAHLTIKCCCMFPCQALAGVLDLSTLAGSSASNRLLCAALLLPVAGVPCHLQAAPGGSCGEAAGPGKHELLT
jgi:hypothetical protein